jgi:hypothetical protein
MEKHCFVVQSNSISPVKVAYLQQIRWIHYIQLGFLKVLFISLGPFENVFATIQGCTVIPLILVALER